MTAEYPLQLIVTIVKGIESYMYATTEAELPYITCEFLLAQLGLATSMRTMFEAHLKCPSPGTVEVVNIDNFMCRCNTLIDCIEEIIDRQSSSRDTFPETSNTPHEICRAIVEFNRQNQLSIEQSFQLLTHQLATKSTTASSSVKFMPQNSVSPIVTPQKKTQIVKSSTPLAVQRHIYTESELPTASYALHKTVSSPIVQSNLDKFNSESGIHGGKKNDSNITQYKLPSLCCTNATHTSTSCPTSVPKVMPTQLLQIKVPLNTVHSATSAQTAECDDYQELSATLTCQCCTEIPQSTNDLTQSLTELPNEDSPAVEKQDANSDDQKPKRIPPERGKYSDLYNACLDANYTSDGPTNLLPILPSPAITESYAHIRTVTDILSRSLPSNLAYSATSSLRTHLSLTHKETIATASADRPILNQEMPLILQQLWYPQPLSDIPSLSIAKFTVTASVTPLLGFNRISQPINSYRHTPSDIMWNTDSQMKMNLPFILDTSRERFTVVKHTPNLPFVYHTLLYSSLGLFINLSRVDEHLLKDIGSANQLQGQQHSDNLPVTILGAGTSVQYSLPLFLIFRCQQKNSHENSTTFQFNWSKIFNIRKQYAISLGSLSQFVNSSALMQSKSHPIKKFTAALTFVQIFKHNLSDSDNQWTYLSTGYSQNELHLQLTMSTPYSLLSAFRNHFLIPFESPTILQMIVAYWDSVSCSYMIKYLGFCLKFVFTFIPEESDSSLPCQNKVKQQITPQDSNDTVIPIRTQDNGIHSSRGAKKEPSTETLLIDKFSWKFINQAYAFNFQANLRTIKDEGCTILSQSRPSFLYFMAYVLLDCLTFLVRNEIKHLDYYKVCWPPPINYLFLRTQEIWNRSTIRSTN